jgi:hypothetical protein
LPRGVTQEQEFFSIVTGDAQYVGSLGVVGFSELSVLFVRVFNWRSQLVNKDGKTPLANFEGSPPRAPARVTYTAGTEGYTNVFDTKGTDNGIMDVKFRDQTTVAQGTAKLTFTYTVAAVIAGPAFVTGGSGISLSTTASNYRPALTYKWWKNGVLMSGVTWPSFTTAGPAVGTSVTYKVEMTDADGDKGTDTHVITGTSTTPPGGGGGGGGCLILKPDSVRSQFRPLGDSVGANQLPCPP